MGVLIGVVTETNIQEKLMELLYRMNFQLLLCWSVTAITASKLMYPEIDLYCELPDRDDKNLHLCLLV